MLCPFYCKTGFACDHARTHTIILSGIPVLDRLKLVEPEQLHEPIVQQHVKGYVVGGAPSVLDRTLLSPQLCGAVVYTHPHPRTDNRFFRDHDRYTLIGPPRVSAF